MTKNQRRIVAHQRLGKVLKVLEAAETELMVTQVQAQLGERSDTPARIALIKLMEAGRVQRRLAFVAAPHVHRTVYVYRLAEGGVTPPPENGDADYLNRGGLGLKDHDQVLANIAAIRAEKIEAGERSPDAWTVPTCRDLSLGRQRHI